MTARYAFPWREFDAYVQGAVVYVGERRSDLRDFENSIIGDVPSYTTVDLTTGIGTGSWNLELYVLNAFDELGEVYRFAQCAEAVCGEQAYSVVTAPRLIGLKFSQRF
jgi:iron complex outermembrane recepter protein